MASTRTSSQEQALARIAAYRPDELVKKMTLPHRIAHFLNWAAANMRMVFFQPNIICRAINGYDRTPRPDTKEVDTIRSAMQRAKKILLDDYKRGYHFERGMGVRATVDDNDKVSASVATAAKRVVSAKENMDKITVTVDEAKLGKSEAAYFRGVTEASKRITATHIRALLPPKSD